MMQALKLICAWLFILSAGAVPQALPAWLALVIYPIPFCIVFVWLAENMPDHNATFISGQW